MVLMKLNPSLVLWGLFLVTAVGLVWLALRTAMTTVKADFISQCLAALFCLLIGVAGLAIWLIFLSLNVH